MCVKNSFIPCVQALFDQYDFIDMFEDNASYFKRNVKHLFHSIASHCNILFDLYSYFNWKTCLITCSPVVRFVNKVKK